MSRAQRVLIFSIKAGAGHLRAAQALEQAFHEEHPGVEVRHIEALQLTSPAFRKTFTGVYERLVKHLPSVWGMIYANLERKPADSRVKKLTTLFDRANSRKIAKTVEEFAPDRIICTHYFPGEVLAAQRRKGKLSTPLHVVLTDYDIHIMWIQDGADGYFVATDEMSHALKAKGIGSARVIVTGIPIVPVFGAAYPERGAMRAKLGLRPGAPTVLVAAGGFGMGEVDKTVALLADGAEDVQLLAIAGRNEKLHRALQAVAATRPGKIVPFGFVDNMHELMAASDFAVTKCGGLTSSECLAMGLPMIIVNPIPGQEERNSDYLLENGVALRANSAAHLAFKVQKLLGDGALRARMSDSARRIARPRAAYEIADCVLR